MSNIIPALLVLVLAVYVIARQFTEQRVSPLNLLLLPVISAYASYTDLPPVFAHFAPLPLIGGLLVGVLVGLASGIFRGRYTRVRLDSISGQIYAKPLLASSLMWLALLAIRITVITLSYSSLSTNLLVGMLIAFGGTVFLVSVSTQKFMVFQQYNHLRTGLPQQVGSQESR